MQSIFQENEVKLADINVKIGQQSENILDLKATANSLENELVTLNESIGHLKWCTHLKNEEKLLIVEQDKAVEGEILYLRNKLTEKQSDVKKLINKISYQEKRISEFKFKHKNMVAQNVVEKYRRKRRIVVPTGPLNFRCGIKGDV